jgi:predicted acetyltransferase
MKKFRLSVIKPEYYDSIRSYRNEILHSDGIFDGCQNLENYEDIEKWDLNCKLFERPDTVPPGYSSEFQYLYLEDENVVGMIDLRPQALSHTFLSRFGGHVGYHVRPSRRRQGIGTEMLKDMLKLSKDTFGLKKLLITCSRNNEGSRGVIVNNGGVYENEIYYPPEEDYLERYWITL